MNFTYFNRQATLQKFDKKQYDIVVIGGGITGAGIALDASLRGLKVALFEKHDFAYGTSSRSTKLIHGGLRYLQNMELGLVFEALSERDHLLKTVPHMVRPLPFFMPVYQGDSTGKFLLRRVSIVPWSMRYVPPATGVRAQTYSDPTRLLAPKADP